VVRPQRRPCAAGARAAGGEFGGVDRLPPPARFSPPGEWCGCAGWCASRDCIDRRVRACGAGLRPAPPTPAIPA
jgi:hypothetical protein